MVEDTRCGAALDGFARRAKAYRVALELDAAAMKKIALEHAGDDFGGLGPARSDQAEGAGDLSSIDGERCVSRHAAHGEVFDR